MKAAQIFRTAIGVLGALGLIQAQTSLKGTGLFTDVSNGGIFRSKIESWAPKKVDGTNDMIYARFSPDGKLIGALSKDGKSVYVMFNDFTGITKLGSEAQQAHAESRVIQWVKNGKWDYELAYPRSDGVASYEVKVDWSNKKLTLGGKRVIAKGIWGWNNAKTSKNGMNGAFDVVGKRILMRESFRAVTHEMLSFDIAAETNDKYAWPADNFNGVASCFHNLTRDGEWVQAMQNTRNDQFKDQQGDHRGFIMFPYRKPGDKMPIEADDYILYHTPGAAQVRNYNTTNDKKVLAAGGQSNGKYYVVEMDTYPPKRNSGRQGKATWTELTTPVSGGAQWGNDLWVGELPALTGTTSLDASTKRIGGSDIRVLSSGNGLNLQTRNLKSEMSVFIFNGKGAAIEKLKLIPGQDASWKAPASGVYHVIGLDGTRFGNAFVKGNNR